VLERYPALDNTDYDLFYDFGVWRYLNFHVGPAITIAAGNFNFDIRGLAGLSSVWPPQLDFQVNYQDDEVFSRRTMKSG
jgi:hypothetical protein